MSDPADTYVNKFDNINILCDDIFASTQDAGWWTDLKTGESTVHTRNVLEMFMLIVTEIAEAAEGVRKNQMDSHLPHRKAEEVELADAVIRIMDYCGAKGLDLGGAMAEKLEYNRTRADHKIENRLKEGGKKC